MHHYLCVAQVDLPYSVKLPQVLGGFYTVHDGHVDIHNYEFEGLLTLVMPLLN